MEPRFNEVAGDRQNCFVKWRVRYIEVLFHTFYCNFGREIILFVISRTSLNRGSLNRGSTVLYCINLPEPVLNQHCIKLTPYKKWTLERVPWASTLFRFHCHLFLNLILLNQSKNKLNKVVMQLFIWAWLGSTRCSSKQNTSRSKSNKRLHDDVKTTVIQT